LYKKDLLLLISLVFSPKGTVLYQGTEGRST